MGLHTLKTSCSIIKDNLHQRDIMRQWLARPTRNLWMMTLLSCLSTNPIKGFRSFLVQETLPLLFSVETLTFDLQNVFSWCNLNKMSLNVSFFLYFFQRSTFVGSAWSFGFFIPATTVNDLRLRRISISDLIHYIIFLSNSSERASISLFNVEC